MKASSWATVNRTLRPMRIGVSSSFHRAVLADMHEECQADDRRYVSEDSMAKLYTPRDTDPVAELNGGQ
jgi:hypothetical protein